MDFNFNLEKPYIRTPGLVLNEYPDMFYDLMESSLTKMEGYWLFAWYS